MRKQLGLVVLAMVLFAGLGSPALLNRALAQPKSLTALQRLKLIGPKPTPRWYWHWQAWRLGRTETAVHRLQPQLRPKQAPRRIPRWAWRRLHLVLLARAHVRPHVGDRYGRAISYTRTRPAFTAARVVEVSDAKGFRSALANLQPGDLVKATADFTVDGETVISKRLSA